MDCAGTRNSPSPLRCRGVIVPAVLAARRAISIAGCALVVVLLSVSFASSVSAQNAAAPQPEPKKHRAVEVTQDGQAVLREDGRVVAFKNTAKDGGPVLIEGLTDIVDISGVARDMRNLELVGVASWIALRPDGSVYQWIGSCAEDENTNCRYSRAVKVAGLSNITAISSSFGTHLALDREGQVWGWGWDNNGLLTGATYPMVTPKLALLKSPVRIPVPVALQWVSIENLAGIGIDRAGGVWTWGTPDRPYAQPADNQAVAAGQMVFRKAGGVPPARAATTQGQTYVVTENDELWLWGIVKRNGSEPFGTRQPHKVDGICPVSSVSVTSGIVAVLCRDGSIYREIWPGTAVYPPCLSCKDRIVTEEKWEQVPFLSMLRRLHLSDWGYGLALIDRVGNAYRFDGAEPGSLFRPLEQLEGPLGLGR